MKRRKVSPENEAPSTITDHPYQPPEGKPWAPCAFAGCGLAESVHQATTQAYDTEGLPYRCPNCVQLDAEVCMHQTEDLRSI